MELPSPEKEVEYKALVGEDGKLILKKKSEIAKGKKAKISGGQFETKVRKDLEEKGWIISKWNNNIDLEEKKIIPAKRKFNPFNKVMTIGTGFPDFIAMQQLSEGIHRVIGIEVKINGTLSREEKEKCKVYLEKKIFSNILIAKRIKKNNHVHIEYLEAQSMIERMK